MVDFDEALLRFAQLIVQNIGSEAASGGRVLRDVYGRLTFVTKLPCGEGSRKLESAASLALGPWVGAGGGIVSLANDEARFVTLTNERAVSFETEGASIKVIDRRLAGDDWLASPSQLSSNPTRIAYYSVKGGVGRSTALAISAADFASRGYNVLIVDLDLEAPGLASLLLTPDAIPTYGVVDWFASVAVGADTEPMIPDMVGSSPFTSSRAIVDIVPASGKSRRSYLSKLARAYAPGSVSDRYHGYTFARKTDTLLNSLASRQRYDVVLIDARAGLHETSGSIILGGGARALVFGVDTSQTYDDLRLLFYALSQSFDPSSEGEDLRSALKMVHAKAPRDERERRNFRERSWEIWSEILYDDVGPDAELTDAPFVFDLNDEDAPHFPLEIVGDETYARFDPRSESYPLSARAYEPIFGTFLSGVRAIAGLS